jgi:hypothetical protein
MAKKEKVGPASAGEDTSHRPANPTAPSSHPTQTTQPDVKTSAQTAAVGPAQMENAMVQQILERQAVFGF